MCDRKLLILRTAQELRHHAAAWDELWRHTKNPAPLARAETLAVWCDSFVAAGDLEVLVVQEADRFLAAFPLVRRRWKGLFDVAALLCNPWANCGEFLLDPLAADVDEVFGLLIEGILHLRWPMLWLEQIPYWKPQWQALLQALRGRGLSVHPSDQWRVGQVTIGNDWQAYEASLSSSHRRNVRRHEKQLQRDGGGRFYPVEEPSLAQLDALVQQGFEVEDRSWKGAVGTSVLRNPGILSFYQRLAHALARNEMLELVYLEQLGQPIAFSYCARVEQTHYLLKIGYDERFAPYSPGQLLTMCHLRYLHHSSEPHRMDFAGRLVPWTASWSTQTYPVGKWVVGLPGLRGRALYQAYRFKQARLPKKHADAAAALAVE